MDLFCLALAYLYDAVEDEACCDTVRNAVAKSHEKTCKESGNRFAEIIPVDLFKGRGHHDADSNQRRGSGLSLIHI